MMKVHPLSHIVQHLPPGYHLEKGKRMAMKRDDALLYAARESDEDQKENRRVTFWKRARKKIEGLGLEEAEELDKEG